MDISGIPVIDTHEHLENVYRWKPEDVGLLHVLMENHYLVADIVAADPENAGRSWLDTGTTPRRALDEAAGALTGTEYEKAVGWFIDRLPLVAQTSDWKSEQAALSDLYELGDYLVTSGNWRALDERIREKYADRDSWYLQILERAGISRLFWCYGEPKLAGPSLPVVPVSGFLQKKRGEVSSAGALAGKFRAWAAEKVESLNPVAFKVGTAYARGIDFLERSDGEVDAALKKLGLEKCFAESQAVSDRIHHLMAEASVVHNTPLQVHTGILAGNGFSHPMAETYVVNMEAFIARNPRTRFDIFHGSFPQWGEAVSLVRRYPNVWLNACWVPTLSESICENMLAAALDACPVNKIMWGGDSHSPEMAYGVLKLFRGVLQRVLEERCTGEALAVRSAEWILWRSAADLYGLDVD
ncbi:MAG: amidohydrolase family protein [Planctomycetes bacterium]|nr:amidohydrolase family protein [Planctomycetota bacterium]